MRSLSHGSICPSVTLTTEYVFENEVYEAHLPVSSPLTKSPTICAIAVTLFQYCVTDNWSSVNHKTLLMRDVPVIEFDSLAAPRFVEFYDPSTAR